MPLITDIGLKMSVNSVPHGEWLLWLNYIKQWSGKEYLLLKMAVDRNSRDAAQGIGDQLCQHTIDK